MRRSRVATGTAFKLHALAASRQLIAEYNFREQPLRALPVVDFKIIHYLLQHLRLAAHFLRGGR